MLKFVIDRRPPTVIEKVGNGFAAFGLLYFPVICLAGVAVIKWWWPL